MADIKVRGFVSKSSVKEGPKGKYVAFTLSEGQKQKDASYKNVFYNVTQFNTETAPEDGSRVELSGWLKMRTYQKDGHERQSLDIVATELAVLAPPKEKAAEPTGAAGEDPFDL